MKRFLLLAITTVMLFSSAKAQTVTDFDGNIYTSVVIGTQEWLQQNIKTKRFNNGDSIAEVVFGNNHCAETTPIYRASYGYSLYLDTVYGQLYTWYAANDLRGICPSGYEVPSKANWDSLNTFLGGSVSGGHLKEAGTSHWILASAGADNSTGFTGLPGGNFLSGGFNNLTTDGYFWTSTELAPGFGQDFRLRASYDDTHSEFSQSCFGYSVICIKSTSTGLDENNLGPQLKIYPNPSSENIFIEWTGIQPEVKSIIVYTMLGEEVKVVNNSNLSVVNITGLTPGEYLLSVTTSMKNYLQKIVIR